MLTNSSTLSQKYAMKTAKTASDSTHVVRELADHAVPSAVIQSAAILFVGDQSQLVVHPKLHAEQLIRKFDAVAFVPSVT